MTQYSFCAADSYSPSQYSPCFTNTCHYILYWITLNDLTPVYLIPRAILILYYLVILALPNFVFMSCTFVTRSRIFHYSPRVHCHKMHYVAKDKSDTHKTPHVYSLCSFARLISNSDPFCAHFIVSYPNFTTSMVFTRRTFSWSRCMKQFLTDWLLSSL